MYNNPLPKRPSVKENGYIDHKEQAIYFTLVDLRELIQKYGVKDVLKQMDSDTFFILQGFFEVEVNDVIKS